MVNIEKQNKEHKESLEDILESSEEYQYILKSEKFLEKVTTLNKIDNSYRYNVDNKLWSHHSVKAVSTFNENKPATHFQRSDYDAHSSIYNIDQQVTGGNNWVFRQEESSDLTSLISDYDSLDIYNEQDDENECPDCIYQGKYEDGVYPAMRLDNSEEMIETFCNKHWTR
ncbi:MAG: hypothetical protein sL5_10860 [Candidatus Mesenet longicola]|uniref:Uncharacterized protein n=1 Tax=Candidatus Mesenet longicola TaxID=1892558 RepID=A0A8J3MPI9_9RICK|nr:MAG: hypothetical protein sGL2_09760 [Candidatus Mesenet longicola]GHM60093.1 MAG: hypothetical protein sL5_10860 [Candidatus Mesenet longicola]